MKILKKFLPSSPDKMLIPCVTLLIIVSTLNSKCDGRLHENIHQPPNEKEENIHHMKLAGWRWEEVHSYLLVALFLLMASFAKIGYHHLEGIHSYVPESCVLIVFGTVIGLLYYMIDIQDQLPFRSEHFFFLLLPPIILESSYSLHDKAFFYNFKTILLYAVFGTVLNILLIGVSLYSMQEILGKYAGYHISLTEGFTFATIVSAVDPVAVLAIFCEIGVNKSLYFLVFGESLLNDAVVITLYNMITTFAALPVISAKDIVIGLFSFFTVSCGGLVIGVIYGAVTALITKTTSTVRVVEPMIVVALAYASYMSAELFHFSGIIALIGCGLVQAEYMVDNIAPNSMTTIKYCTKTASSISDVIIFFYLGRVLVRDDHVWSTGFVAFTTLFCIIYRFFSVFVLTAIANKFIQSTRRINFQEQVLMAYGGLRGAIAFSLALSLDPKHIKNSQLFVTTSLFLILFTVFVLGSTTKPVIKFLHVKLHDEAEYKTMFMEINDRVFDTLMSGIEEIAGCRSVYYWTQRFGRFNQNVLKQVLTAGDGHSFKHTYEEVRRMTIRRSIWRRDDPKSSVDSTSSGPLEESNPESPSSSSPASSHENISNTNQTEDKKTVQRKVILKKAATVGLPAAPGSPPVVDFRRQSQLRHSSVAFFNRNPSLKERRNSRRVVNAMFAQSRFYHLPQRDLIDTEVDQSVVIFSKRRDTWTGEEGPVTSRQTSLNTDSEVINMSPL